MHIDHGLRPESSSDVVAVAALADALGVGMVSHRIAVGTGPNLEERARNSRYALLPDDVCTGHTAEDLAETVLLHLMRGAGLDGIASMARPRPGGVQRPLLALRRAETEALCASLGLSTVTDAMNTDPQFRRVRVRREVLPLLDDVAERDVVPLLARHAEVTADDVALLDELARGVDPTQRWGLRDVAPALARRAVRRWLVSSGVGGGRAVDAATIERVLAVAAGSTPRADVEGGWQVERTNGTLRLTRPSVE